MSGYGLEEALKILLGIEGDFSDDPADSGGATRWGITEFLARAHGYTGEMRDLPLAKAKEIYNAEYWWPLRLAEIGALSPSIAYEIFDTAVNTPPGTPAVFLQRLLNANNNLGTLYPDIAVDGRIGEKTIAALTRFLTIRKAAGEEVLLAALNGLQIAYYTDLVERRQKDEKWFWGWLLQRGMVKHIPQPA